MTKDELNEVLKEKGMYLSPVCDGTSSNGFFVIYESRVVVDFDGVSFIFSRDYRAGYRKKIVAALLEYANTPVEERKPKPQLYNIIIAHDTVRNGFYLTAWQKDNESGEYFVNSCIKQHDLSHDDDLKFTVEEIEDLKSKVSEKQKQIIDIGIVKVGETMPTKVDTTNGYEVDKEQKYYIHVFKEQNGYLNIVNDKVRFYDNAEGDGYKTKFTDKEIEQLKQRNDIPLDWNKVTFEEDE